MQNDFFNLLFEDKCLALALLPYLTLLRCWGLSWGGDLLRGRPLEFAGAQLSARSRGLLLRLRLLTSLLLSRLLAGLLSVARGRGGLGRRAFHLGRAQRLSRFRRCLLRLGLIGLRLGRRRRGSALRQHRSGKAEYRNRHKAKAISPLGHSIRLWHRRGVAVGL